MKFNKLILTLLLSTTLYCSGDDGDDTGGETGSTASAGGVATEGSASEGSGTEGTGTEGTTGGVISGPACDEFESPTGSISGVPGTYTGDLNGSGADFAVLEGDCTLTGTFYDQPGEEQVVQLSGLTVGSPYLLTAEAVASDISFYLTQGCDDGSFGNGLCELFVDNGGNAEAIIFEATSESIYMVVDQFSPDATEDGAFTVNIAEVECSDTVACSGDQTCLNGACVGCVGASDCTDPTLPICDAESNTCVGSYDECTGDDPSPPEGADDGPSGALAITFDQAMPTVYTGNICSQPSDESDYFTFNIPSEQSLRVSLAWTSVDADMDMSDDIDMDMQVFDSLGTQLLASQGTTNPEAFVGTFPPGDYFLRVFRWSRPEEGVAAAVPYTLTLEVPECTTLFDCNDPTKPLCGTTGECVAGPDECVADDAGEASNDDGPAGARVLSPTVGGPAVTQNGTVCSQPESEIDYYKVSVNAGDNLSVSITWPDTDPMAPVDLDLQIFDMDQKALGLSFWVNPEVVELTNLPAGDYTIGVTKFDEVRTAAVAPYTLSATRTAGGCATDADCATEYTTQFFRGSCEASACSFIEGNQTLADGDACDSDDDCASAACSYWSFESDAETSVCTTACAAATDPCPTGQHCFVEIGKCVLDCTTDSECGVNSGSNMLDAGLPWDTLTCDAATSSCGL